MFKTLLSGEDSEDASQQRLPVPMPSYVCESTCDSGSVSQKLLCGLCQELLYVLVPRAHRGSRGATVTCWWQEHSVSHVHISMEDRLYQFALDRLAKIREATRVEMDSQTGILVASLKHGSSVSESSMLVGEPLPVAVVVAVITVSNHSR